MSIPAISDWAPLPHSHPFADSSHAPGLRLVPGGGQAPAEQLALPLQWHIAPGVPAHPSAEIHSIVDPFADVPDEDSAESDTELLAGSMPDPKSWTAQIARAIYEVAHGERPPSQLHKWVTRPQVAKLAARGQSFRRHPATKSRGSTSRLRRIRGVRCCYVAPGLVEACAVIEGTTRSSAMALRLQAHRGRWIVTAVEMR
ncbi:MAG: hypothetical protein RJB01_341 [Actinomycetota bacterium]